MKKTNYIIVGQGLAGTILAQTFLMEGKSIVIIDELGISNASKIAAGLFNPVVFKRLVKSWMADELLPCMDDFYTKAELLLGTQFYFKKQILKPFSEEQEKVLWLKKSSEDIGKYLGKTMYDNFINEIIYSPLGASEVIQSGNLDTGMFLHSFRDYFIERGFLLEERFNFKQLVISENSVTYKNIEAEKIIFCEGFKAVENPYFSWLPFKLTKGEIITIKLKENHIIPSDKVINKGVFILPLGNNTYKVGATYEWQDLSEVPTKKGKNDLIEKLQKVIKVPFEITNHQAGVRPTVNDRRPLIGVHPDHPSIAIFNGLGTKGVMLAPYFAKQFVNFLEHQSPLNIDANINRFL